MTTDSREQKREFILQMRASYKQLNNSLKLQRGFLKELANLPSDRKAILMWVYRGEAVSAWQDSFMNTLKLYGDTVRQQLNILRRHVETHADMISTSKLSAHLEKMTPNLELQLGLLNKLADFPSTFPQDVLEAHKDTDVEDRLKVWENSITEPFETLSLLLKEQNTNLDTLKNILDELETSKERRKIMTTDSNWPMSRKQGVFLMPDQYETKWLSYPHDDLYVDWEKSLGQESYWEKVKNRLSHFDCFYENYLLVTMASVGVPCYSWAAVFVDIESLE